MTAQTQPTTAITLNQKKLGTLKDLLKSAQPSFAQVLPRHLTPERMIKIALAACSRTPLLLQCTPQSILQSVLSASQLGLEPGSALGLGYLVPYKNKHGTYEAQFIPGYRGLIDLARRSGQIRNIEARVVHELDAFEYSFGLEPKLKHVPLLRTPKDEKTGKSTRNELVAVYAVAHLVSGGSQFEVMSKDEIDRIRGRSRAGDSGPWVTDYEEMAKKTTIRRLSKYIPLSVELAAALELENRAETGEVTVFSDIIDVTDEATGAVIATPGVGDASGATAAAPASKSDQLAEKVAAAAADANRKTDATDKPGADS